MREYETLYILHPRLDEAEVTAASEKFAEVITTNGGEISLTNPWGKRRLAYEINHVKEGSYIQTRFNGEKIVVDELERALKFSDAVLRYLTVRTEDLDPAVTDTIPEQLPEPSADDYEDRRSRGPRREYHRQEAPVEEAAAPASEEAAPAEVASEEPAPAGDEEVAVAEEAPVEAAEESAAEPVAEPVAEEASEA